MFWRCCSYMKNILQETTFFKFNTVTVLVCLPHMYCVDIDFVKKNVMTTGAYATIHVD